MRRERRKRIRRPIALSIFAIFLMVEPMLQLIGLSIWKDISIRDILESLSYLQLVFLFFPIVPGFGLYQVKKWGWFSFLVYSVCLIAFNIFATFKNPSNYNWIALSETIFVFFMMFYFLRKDISAPYFKMYPRGWRGEEREPIRKKVNISGIWTWTKDISDSGFYAEWDGEDLQLGSELVAFFEEDSNTKRKVGVVRIDEAGVGFAYRGD
jgi:hypothetical protein